MFFFDIRKISVWEVLHLFLVGNVIKNVLFLPFFKYQVDDCKHESNMTEAFLCFLLSCKANAGV